MSRGLHIADVAERAGISTATVRYYERIGVLPAPARAGNGYRTYDEHTIERLAFINRAKQLGCTLDEIGDLTTAWDGGACGPIQDRLRSLVADKLAVARNEIIDLVTVCAELQHAAAALERHRPTGSCDERCGCIGDPSPADATGPAHAVVLAARPIAPDGSSIACTLPADRTSQRIAAWNQLLGEKRNLLRAAVARIPIVNGLRLEFPEDSDAAEIARLAAAEQDCCRFFSFVITIDQRGIGLEVTAPDDGLPAVHALFGVPS